MQLRLDSGELRSDLDIEMIVSILDWTMDRFQDALLTEELDPGLFRRQGAQPDRVKARVEEFLKVLRGSIGAGTPGRGAEPESEGSDRHGP